MTQVVILAAGKGTRMHSDLPKVLHTLADKPFIQHVIDTSKTLNPSHVALVIGHGAEQVKSALIDEALEYVEQKEQLGTGHAVAQALPLINNDSPVLILYGDVPLISKETLNDLLKGVTDRSMALLTYHMENPTGYGRIVRNANQQVVSIVEQKDADPAQLEISEINTGVMAVHGKHLHEWLPNLDNRNAQQEYYLTDLIAMAVQAGIDVRTTHARSELEITGVNNRVQQSQLERAYQLEQANRLLGQGLTLYDPTRFDLRGRLIHGRDCKIDINCIFEGEVTIGSGVEIGPNCCIKNAKIGDNVKVHANTLIEDAVIDTACTIGPFARLRPGTELASGAKIGNFVETKKAKIGEGSKVNHLSYVGDAELGQDVNVGAGTITCNYDGVNKHQTTIGDYAFIGSNSALVAPVDIAKNTTVAAGSTVTKNSQESQLVLARAKQKNMDGWLRPKKK